MARTVGIISNLDVLGRVTLPAEYRKYLGIELKDAVEIVLEEDAIVIKPSKRRK
jgi:AbrB family looped-hinge helix DNA binding protein